MKETLIMAIARALYESNQFKKPWDHPDTVRLWHPVCIRYAKAALKTYHALARKAAL